jgi:hypothetical protein
MAFDDEFNQARAKASGRWSQLSKTTKVLIYIAAAIVVVALIGWAVGSTVRPPLMTP